MVTRSTSSFGLVGTDWQQRINWERLRKYRLNRAREAMKRNGLGALLVMYDENVRYITSTVTPGWCRLKPGLRYALLCEGAEPVLFEQGDIGIQINRHCPWIPRVTNHRSRAIGGPAVFFTVKSPAGDGNLDQDYNRAEGAEAAEKLFAEAKGRSS